MAKPALAGAAIFSICLASRADEPRPAEATLSLGGGLAYELAGFNASYRYYNIEGYVGLGFMSLFEGFSAGARLHARDDGSGFFLGLNGAAHFAHFIDDQATGGSFYWLTVTPGWRWNSAGGALFAQAALGGGVAFAYTTYNTPPSPTRKWAPTPDAALAVGFRF